MAKSNAVVKKTYPDLTELFAAKEQARMERAKQSPREKLATVGRLQKINQILKSAKIVKKGGIKKG